MALRSHKLYVAIDSGVAEVDGRTCTFSAGKTRIPAGHLLLRKNAVFFEPLEHRDREEERNTLPSEPAAVVDGL
jgi:hypothetical protein